jgi:hypothetical protein
MAKRNKSKKRNRQEREGEAGVEGLGNVTPPQRHHKFGGSVGDHVRKPRVCSTDKCKNHSMELPAKEVCYRALQSRAPRFDGLI